MNAYEMADMLDELSEDYRTQQIEIDLREIARKLRELQNELSDLQRHIPS
jgi:hypothetical protein